MGTKKTTLTLILVFTLVLVSFPKFNLVKAQDSPICIRADGTVEGTDLIQREGNVYTLTGNIVNQSILVERDNVVVDGSNFTLEGGHIWLENRNNVTIRKFEIIRSDEGIRIMGNSANNSIIGNNITDIYGINAIWIYLGASNNTISGNIISNSDVGIKVDMSGSTTISENYISSNGLGIWLSGNNNRIVRNNIGNNSVGIRDFNGGNFIQHNNFVNNSVAANPQELTGNIWDDGYPSGGNYWSNYNGTDNNGDGIGDTPYIIDENNQDNYPFISPIDIETIPEFPSSTILALVLSTFLGILIFRKKLVKSSKKIIN